MSEHTPPQVRIAVWPPSSVMPSEPPYNVEVTVDGDWVALGVLGSTSFGGPGAKEKTEHYRKAVTEVMHLLLAAPKLLAALKRFVPANVACHCHRTAHPSGICAQCQARAALAMCDVSGEAKGEAQPPTPDQP